MTWILLSLLSALLLGLYDIAKKASVRDNAVPAVLLANVSCAAAVWMPLIIWSGVYPEEVPDWLASAMELNGWSHLLLFCKSAIVGASWICAFFALKHLPISIAAPIRGTSPLVTISVAVIWMAERPSPLQWLGVIIVLAAFFAFSRIGVGEGVPFHRDRWVFLMILATVLGGCSALYDKYLLQSLRLSPWAVQAWFSVYLVPIMIPLALYWLVRERSIKPFQWRWSIPLIAVLLLFADITYFYALANPEAMIAIISPLRRTAMIVSFLYGVFFLREKNATRKAICIAALLCGVTLICQ